MRNDTLRELSMDAVLEIKKMQWEHIRHGGQPSKITMSTQTFIEIVDELNDLIAVNKEGHIVYQIFGMDIEMRDDIDQNTMFIIS